MVWIHRLSCFSKRFLFVFFCRTVLLFPFRHLSPVGDPLSEHSYLLPSALATDPSRLASVPFLPSYSAALRDLIKRGVNSSTNYHFPLLGCKVVVDAGNGSGGFFADQVSPASTLDCLESSPRD